MNKRKAYSLLGISENASDGEIKQAYRKAASKWHPDRYSDAAEKKHAEERFKEIKAAYEFLTNPQPNNPFANRGPRFDDANADINELIAKMMRRGGFNFSGFNQSPHTTVFRTTIAISLKEAFEGCTKQVIVNAFNNPLNEKIVIPAGISDGMVVHTATAKVQEGLEAICQFIVSVETNGYTISWPGQTYQENSGNIVGAINISPYKLISGGWQDYTTIDGSTIQVRVPAGMEAGKALKVKGKGYWRDMKCDARGNVYLRVMPKIEKLVHTDPDELLQFVQAAIVELQKNSPEHFNILAQEILSATQDSSHRNEH